jgi:HEAT repeat protein
MTEEESPASERAAGVIVGFGPVTVARLAPLVGDPRWFVQRNAARLLGRIGSAEAVPLLQPLLRQADPRVARAAVSALGGIDDPSAARAVHAILRAATGNLRRAVVDALVADRDPRIVPMLIRIVCESDPMGKDHQLVLETLTALGTVGSEEAVPTLATMAQRRSFFRRRKLRALKQRSVEALARIGTPKADAATREAVQSGDRMLRKIVAARSAAR